LYAQAHEWDDTKAKRNYRIHGVRFQEALPVLDDPSALTIVDDVSDPQEQRYVTIGMGALGRVLVVVYTYRGEDTRIISARKAEAHELQAYGGI
jgi:uncharacterized protein